MPQIDIDEECPSLLTSTDGEVMSLKSVKAHGHVAGLSLDMRVRQTYRNDTDKTLETVYTFPLAWGAVLLGLDVEIGGKRLSGVVIARNEAEKRYEEAIAEADSPIMLEQSADGLYTLNVGNLKPGEEAVIEYRYAQLLVYAQDRIRISVPTTIAPRYGDAAAEAGIRRHEAVDTDPLVEYPLELALTLAGEIAKGVVESPSHTISTRCQDGELLVTLGRNAYLDRDFVLTIEGLAGRSLATAAADGDGSVVLASFCPRIPGARREAITLKILVDCSGSMNGDSIRSARKALNQVLAELGPADRFTYSRFGSTVVHPIGRLTPANPSNLRQAALLVQNTAADMGGTEIEAALDAVFTLCGTEEGGDVLLITDGEVWNTKNTIEAARRSGHRIFAVGVGNSPAESLLRQLAEETGGACELVAPNEDIEAAIVRMFRRIRLPRADQLAIDWHATPKWTTPLPKSLFDGETVHVFAGFDAPPPLPPVLSFAVGGTQSARVAAPSPTPSEGDVLPRLAASQRLKHLPDDIAAQLAERYQLVTRQTSLFLVYAREGDDKATDLPHLQKIAHMQAAGWGGRGSVVGAVHRSCVALPHDAIDYMYQPLFCMGMIEEIELETIGDDAMAPATDSASLQLSTMPKVLRSRIELLLEIVDGVANPEELRNLIAKIERDSKTFEPLGDIVKEISRESGNKFEAWLAMILWADGQVESAHKLSRHAARAVRRLSAAIPHDRLDALTREIRARMAMLSQDGWPESRSGASV